MDEILNSRSLNSVRFRMAKPQGYYTEDVENFIDNEVRNSIATYELKISDQEREIVTLNNKIDEFKSKISELEIKANFNDASGNAEQDAALVAALENNETLEKQVAALKADLSEKEEFINQLNSYIDEIQPYVEAGISAAGLVNDVASINEEETPEVPTIDDTSNSDTDLEEETELDDDDLEVNPEALSETLDEEDLEEETELDDDDLEVDPEALRQALAEEDSEEKTELDDDDLEVDPEALRQAMEESQPKKFYINNAVEEDIQEEIVEEKIVDTFFEMDDDLEVDEEALRKALEESDGDDEITTNYR